MKIMDKATALERKEGNRQTINGMASPKEKGKANPKELLEHGMARAMATSITRRLRNTPKPCHSL